jgi:hypothetical protein
MSKSNIRQLQWSTDLEARELDLNYRMSWLMTQSVDLVKKIKGSVLLSEVWFWKLTIRWRYPKGIKRPFSKVLRNMAEFDSQNMAGCLLIFSTFFIIDLGCILLKAVRDSVKCGFLFSERLSSAGSPSGKWHSQEEIHICLQICLRVYVWIKYSFEGWRKTCRSGHRIFSRDPTNHTNSTYFVILSLPFQTRFFISSPMKCSSQRIILSD